jgi:Sulfatase
MGARVNQRRTPFVRCRQSTGSQRCRLHKAKRYRHTAVHDVCRVHEGPQPALEAHGRAAAGIHQNGLRGGIVLGLRQQVGGQPSGVVLPIGDMSTNFPSAEWKGKSQQGNFSDSMMELDANVGKVLQAVRDAGIEKDTIVVFSSDNGPWVDAWPDAGYGPFRGAKGTPLENGWRVPGLIWALGRIQAGTVLHGMMSYIYLAHDCRDGGP